MRISALEPARLLVDWCEDARKMKVCMISPHPVLNEGIARYSKSLIDGFRKIGVNVIPVPFYRSCNLYLVGEFTRITDAIKVVHAVTKLRPDIVHIQFTSITYPKFTLALLLLGLRLLSTSLVLTQHEVSCEREGSKIRVSFEKLIYGSVKGIVVHTQDARTCLLRVGVDESKIWIIPHGIPDGSVIDKKEARRRLGLDLDSAILLVFGYISPHKGIERAIRALKNVKCVIPKVHLVVAGGPHPQRPNDKYVAWLKALTVAEGLEEYVMFTGFVQDDLVELYFRAADLLLLPYLKITQSGVLCQAVANGLPIVATAIGGLAEQLSEYGIGELVPTGSELEIATAIVQLLTNRERLSSLSRNELEMSKMLSWDAAAGKHLDAYCEVREKSWSKL